MLVALRRMCEQAFTRQCRFRAYGGILPEARSNVL